MGGLMMRAMGQVEVGDVWLAGPDILGEVSHVVDHPDGRVTFSNGRSSFVSTLLDPECFYALKLRHSVAWDGEDESA